MLDQGAAKALFAFLDDWKPEIRVHAGDAWDFRNLRRGASDDEKAASLVDDWDAGSEFLTMVPVIHRYFDNDVKARGEHLDKVNSMLAVIEVIMLLLALKTGTVSADQLTNEIVKHVVLFQSAWGEDYVRPKHH